MIVFRPTELDLQTLAELAVLPEAIANDGRDYTCVTVQKPWGHEMQFRGTAEYAGTRLDLRAGAETSMHCHPGKTVVLVVERDGVWIERLDGERHYLTAGAGAIVESRVFHRLRAGAGGAAVTEIEFPPNKQDLVRLEDAYGRQGQGYEHAAG